MPQVRKTQRLRRGRASLPNARYFVTICSSKRKLGLSREAVGSSIRKAIQDLIDDGDIELLCSTLMPDHLHLLFKLKDRISLSQVVAKLKFKTRAALKSNHLEWQSNFFDHRLRSHTSAETFARYIYLNPFRKNLNPHPWPWWICGKNYQPEFTEHLGNDGMPPKEWLTETTSLEDMLKNDVDD